jgi:hypothetical protein
MLLVAIANVVLGMAFALLARDRIRADGPFIGPAFLLVLLHAGGVVAPVALYFYTVHGAWAWHYLVDPDKVPGLAIFPLIISHGALVIAGWYGAATLLRNDRGRIALYATAGLGATLLVVALLLAHRLGTSSTYEGFHAGRGANLLDVALGYALIVSMMASAGSAGYVAAEIVRDARRVRAR